MAFLQVVVVRGGEGRHRAHESSEPHYPPLVEAMSNMKYKHFDWTKLKVESFLAVSE
jgi:hypothetical protein